MKQEHDFSKGERGKFLRENARLDLPVHPDEGVQRHLREQARSKGMEAARLVNEMFRPGHRAIRGSEVTRVSGFADRNGFPEPRSAAEAGRGAACSSAGTFSAKEARLRKSSSIRFAVRGMGKGGERQGDGRAHMQSVGRVVAQGTILNRSGLLGNYNRGPAADRARARRPDSGGERSGRMNPSTGCSPETRARAAPGSAGRRAGALERLAVGGAAEGAGLEAVGTRR